MLPSSRRLIENVLLRASTKISALTVLMSEAVWATLASVFHGDLRRGD
jgi:hypothetical protein